MFFSIIAWLLAFAVAITVHEFAHAWTANKLGDPTPKLMGRLSLNPLVHYDKVGTTLLLFLVILRSFGYPVIPFGWAKPVQFDPYNLKSPKRDAALISFAGPLSNLLLATILSLFVQLVSATQSPLSLLSLIATLLIPTIALNVVLAIFNLIPVHPLDGGKILVGLLPEKDSRKVDMFLRRYGIMILVLLIFPFRGSSAVSVLITPIISAILGVLLPSSQLI